MREASQSAEVFGQRLQELTKVVCVDQADGTGVGFEQTVLVKISVETILD